MVRPAETGNEVTVVFADAALNFALPQGATLEDLASRLAVMEQHHLGEPQQIAVKFSH
jgi:hypothetical protein